MNRRIRNRTYGGVEAGSGRLDLAIRCAPGMARSVLLAHIENNRTRGAGQIKSPGLLGASNLIEANNVMNQCA